MVEKGYHTLIATIVETVQNSVDCRYVVWGNLPTHIFTLILSVYYHDNKNTIIILLLLLYKMSKQKL